LQVQFACEELLTGDTEFAGQDVVAVESVLM
jgi:hypothetical protein